MAIVSPTAKQEDEDLYTYDFGDDAGASETPASVPAASFGTPAEDVYTYDFGDEPAPEPDQSFGDDVLDFVGDTAIDAASGTIKLGQSLIGVGSLLSGGLLSDGMRAIGYRPEEATAFLKDMYSSSRKREEAEFEAAKGWDAAVDLLTSPGLLFGKVVETAPQMLGMIAIGKAFAARAFAGAYKAAIKKGVTEAAAKKVALEASIKAATASSATTEGAMQAGSSFDQYMAEGMELGKAYTASVGSGITTGLQAFVGGKVGTKMGLGDISAGTTSKGGKISRLGKGMAQEGLLEEGPQSVWEQMWDNYAHDRPLTEGVEKAAATGIVVGGAAGGGFNLAMGSSKTDPDVPGPNDPDQTKILFKPTHTINGIPVQQATKRGEILPDTYVNQAGDIVRPTIDDSVEQTAELDLSNDVDAVAEQIKAEVNQDNPYNLIRETPMPTGLVGSQMDLTAPLGTEPTQAQLDEEIAPDLSQPIEFDAIEDTTMTGEDATQLFTDVMGEEISYAEDRAAEAATAATSTENDLLEPTEDQKSAGNYKKAHPTVQGFNISIENPQGSRRKPEWPELTADYGYIKRTVGADSEAGAAPHEVEQVDVFVKHDVDIPADNPVYIVDQVNKDGTFDETKVMMGYESTEAASEGYLSNYTKGWDRVNAVTEATPEQLRTWLDDPAANDEYAAYLRGEPKVLKPVKPKKLKPVAKKPEIEPPPTPAATETETAETKPAEGKVVAQPPIEKPAAKKAPFDAKDMKARKVEGEAVKVKKCVGAQCFRNTVMEAGKLEKPILEAQRKAGVKGKLPDTGYNVVHGQVTNIEGKRFDHSWIETPDGQVIDPTTGVTMDKAKYYGLLSAEADTIYSSEEAAVNAVKTGHYGPWTAEEIGNELLARRDESAQPDIDSDPYISMRGRDLEIKVKVESTGKIATLTVDSATAMEEADARVESLEELRRCL